MYGDNASREGRNRGRKVAKYMNEEEEEVTGQKIDEGGPSG
jgi:hypothetical protein